MSSPSSSSSKSGGSAAAAAVTLDPAVEEFSKAYEFIPEREIVDFSMKDGEEVLALQKVRADMAGTMNKHLIAAEIDRIVRVLADQMLLEEVEERMLVPISGRGDGRDCAVKTFYRGDGSHVLTTDPKMLEKAKQRLSNLIGAKKLKIKSNMSDPKTLVAINDAEKWRVARPALIQKKVDGSKRKAGDISADDTVDVSGLDPVEVARLQGMVDGMKAARKSTGGP